MNKDIGANVRRNRMKLGLTQAQLAGRAKIGRRALTNIENGKARPRRKTLHRLADALGRCPFELEFSSVESRIAVLRNKPGGHAEGLLSILAIKLDQYLSLERWTGLDKTPEFPDVQGVSPVEVAKLLRGLARIRPGYSPDCIVRGVEAFGFRVVPFRYMSEAIIGAALPPGGADRKSAVWINTWDRIPVEQRLYTLALGLSHLLDPRQEAENRHRFASHFLVGDSELANHWRDTEGLPIARRLLILARSYTLPVLLVVSRLLALGDSQLSKVDRSLLEYASPFSYGGGDAVRRRGFKDKLRLPHKGEAIKPYRMAKQAYLEAYFSKKDVRGFLDLSPEESTHLFAQWRKEGMQVKRGGLR